MKINSSIGVSWVMMLQIGASCTSGLPSAGWDSSEVIDEDLCKFTDSQIQNLLNLLEKCSQRLEGRSNSNHLCKINDVSLSARHSDKCDQYLKKIESGLVNVATEALRLKEAGAATVGSAEKIRKLEDSNQSLNNALKNLLRKHDQELAQVKNKFNQLVQQYNADVTRLSNELKETQTELFKSKLDRIVLKLTYETVENAIEVVKHFFEKDKKGYEKLGGQIARNSISQVYSDKGMPFWGKLMLFIDKLPQMPEKLEGYQQLLKEMNPLSYKDADILLKFAHKIKQTLNFWTGWSENDKKALKDSFPKTIRDLMWHDHCKIINKKYAHYMKVVSEDQHGTMAYHIVGENNILGNSQWRLNPYQSTFPDGQVKFRVENVGTRNYLKGFGAVEFGPTVRTADSFDANWEIKFANNRVASQTEKSAFYLFAPAIKKYLYEAQRTWEPWRCGFNQWLDCAVISQEDKMYDEGKWILDCKV